MKIRLKDKSSTDGINTDKITRWRIYTDLDPETSVAVWYDGDPQPITYRGDEARDLLLILENEFINMTDCSKENH